MTAASDKTRPRECEEDKCSEEEEGKRADDHGWHGAVQVVDNNLDDGLERAEEEAPVKGSG
eukprot:6274158-Prymnesium_polylepis.1